MRERSRSESEEIVRTLAADEARHDVAPDATSVYMAAVEAESTPVKEAKLRRRGLRVGGWLALIWIVLLLVVSALAPLILPDALHQAPAKLWRHGPTLKYPFGLTERGQNVFVQSLWAARNSLFIGFVAIALGFFVGGLIGLVAGYFKGRIGAVLGAITDILLAFPALVLAIAIVTIRGQSMFNVTLALAIVSIPILSRITRASTLTWTEREFVLASRAQGGKHLRLMFSEILPNVLPAMFSIALLGIAVVIVSEGGLAILGAGVPQTTLTWGTMIVRGQPYIRTSPHMVLFPCMMIFLTVLALNHLGDVVREKFDVRESAL